MPKLGLLHGIDDRTVRSQTWFAAVLGAALLVVWVLALTGHLKAEPRYPVQGHCSCPAE